MDGKDGRSAWVGLTRKPYRVAALLAPCTDRQTRWATQEGVYVSRRKYVWLVPKYTVGQKGTREDEGGGGQSEERETGKWESHFCFGFVCVCVRVEQGKQIRTCIGTLAGGDMRLALAVVKSNGGGGGLLVLRYAILPPPRGCSEASSFFLFLSHLGPLDWIGLA